jgi:predicted dithiol-disulfide oxidoreductase (DUF899 family)
MTTPMATTLHTVRFPGETEEYRAARDELLRAEMDLRRQIESVAELRRALPLGGEVPEDYAFEEMNGSDRVRETRLSELFEPGKDTLIVYSFMYGPEMEAACPSCTSILDALDGAVQHATQRVNVAVVGKSPIERIHAHARNRGWSRLRLLSSATNTYNRDYHGETGDGHQIPALNVFMRRGRKIHHTYSSELLYAPREEGQSPRHVDSIWPIWSLFDLTHEGRGDWNPSLRYD